MGIVYMATHRENAMRYVGKTTQGLLTRQKQHYVSARKQSQSHFHKAIRQYGIDAFDWQIIETVADSALDHIERFYIYLYKKYGIELYNHTDGGDGPAKHSAETRRMISEALKGKNRRPIVLNQVKTKKRHGINLRQCI